MAAAGLWTNPTELAHLALDVQASFRGEPGRVLSQDMTRAQLTPGLGGYGLGFGVQGEGYKFIYVFDRSEGGRGVFIMTNGDRGSALAQEIVLAVANEYDWPEPRYQEVALFDVPRDVLQEIAGGYRIVDQELNLAVTVVEDYLRVAVGTPGETESLQVLEVYPTAEDLFVDLMEGTRLRVDRDEAGSVTALQIVGGPRAERVQN